jgi:hypothetical protein
MTKPKTPGQHQQVIIKLANRAKVIAALPGTRREIAAATNLPIGTVQDHVLRLVREGAAVVVSRGKGGKTWVESRYDIAGRESPMPENHRTIKAPVTQYHTRWIGGRYPAGCAA